MTLCSLHETVDEGVWLSLGNCPKLIQSDFPRILKLELSEKVVFSINSYYLDSRNCSLFFEGSTFLGSVRSFLFYLAT